MFPSRRTWDLFIQWCASASKPALRAYRRSSARAVTAPMQQNQKPQKPEVGENGRKEVIMETEEMRLLTREIEFLEMDRREEALKLERAKASIKRDFDYIREDIAEYIGAECSPENYESLQVILKKVFRALKRAGLYDETIG